eukprot:gb/GECG01007592.1/.p1 GENE.gb/GECG01007592.1/~~gb/GECG01007592.1/.p1  ORF type:complete len:103 (+),score=5.80 gb/GECG01007592.1/:1-309(+)
MGFRTPAFIPTFWYVQVEITSFEEEYLLALKTWDATGLSSMRLWRSPQEPWGTRSSSRFSSRTSRPEMCRIGSERFRALLAWERLKSAALWDQFTWGMPLTN